MIIVFLFAIFFPSETLLTLISTLYFSRFFYLMVFILLTISSLFYNILITDCIVSNVGIPTISQHYMPDISNVLFSVI